jgi:DNA-binding XRE family transcriptional regulator
VAGDPKEDHMVGIDKATRDEYICGDYAGGHTMEHLSREYGVTRQRIQQILHQKGVKIEVSRIARGTHSLQAVVSPIHQRLGHRLQEFRIDRGLSKQDLAQFLSISTQKVSKLERGIDDLGLLDFLEVCRKTKITIEDVIKMKE